MEVWAVPTPGSFAFTGLCFLAVVASGEQAWCQPKRACMSRAPALEACLPHRQPWRKELLLTQVA